MSKEQKDFSTWKDIKEFVNSLTEEQLSKRVILWREDEAINKIQPDVLEEDHYIDKEGVVVEGCVDESTAKELIKDNPEDYPNGMKHFTKVYDKGFPILFEKF